MIALLLAATASLPTAVDAERAFARDAQRRGQWTAFRAYAHPDAVMFTPQTVWAQQFLKGRKDPPQSVAWWPLRSFVSCDGRTAVNTGPWVRKAQGTHGYFTTVWQREHRRWQWVYDGGDASAAPATARQKPWVRMASCGGRAPGAPLMAPPSTARHSGGTPPDDFGRGQSADGTLGWDWKVEANGERRFRAFLWNGSNYEQVVHEDVKAQ